MKSIEEVKRMLSFISPDDRDDWMRVGMALKNEGYDFDLWDTWSQGSDKYSYEGAQGTANQWNSFNKDGLHMGTIVMKAKENGYIPDRSSANTFFVQADRYGLAPLDQTKEQLEALFKRGESFFLDVPTWDSKKGKWRPDGKSGMVMTLEDLPVLEELLKQDNVQQGGLWITENPCIGKEAAQAWKQTHPKNIIRCKENITAFRHCLVEADDMPLEEQESIVRDLRLPIATLTESGGKSVHAVVKVEAEDQKQYTERVNKIHETCKAAGLHIDTQNKDQSRLTRLAGVQRGVGFQRLIATNIGCSTFEEWEQWRNEDLPKPLVSLSIADLAAQEVKPVDWLIKGILPVYGLCMLTAPPKSYKSFMVLDMCLSIASGQPFMGFETCRNEVLYIDTENPSEGLIERIQLIDQQFRERKEQYKGFYAVPWSPDSQVARIGSGLRYQLEDQIRQHPKLKLIVIDMFSGVKPVKNEAGKGVYMAELMPLEELRDFAFENNITVLVVHHNKKKSEVDALESVSGSSGTTGAVSELMVIQRPDRTTTDATLHVTGKRVPEETLCCSFDKKKMRWECMGTEAEVIQEKKKEDFMKEPITQAVRELVMEEKEIIMTSKELKEACGLEGTADKIGKFIGTHIDDFARHCGIVITDKRVGNARKRKFLYWIEPNDEASQVS